MKSEPLHALVSNGMHESQNKIVMLPDEDAETFGYVTEWASTGVYRASVKDLSGIAKDFADWEAGNLTLFMCKCCGTYNHINSKSEPMTKQRPCAELTMECHGSANQEDSGGKESHEKPDSVRRLSKNHFVHMSYALKGRSMERARHGFTVLIPRSGQFKIHPKTQRCMCLLRNILSPT